MQPIESERRASPSGDDTFPSWHSLPVDETLRQLETDVETGLAETEAQDRLAEHGPNRLLSRGSPSPWALLLDQFKEAMVLVLMAAAAVSYLVGDLKDTLVVLAIVVLNAALGFSQEYRAERAMEGLRQFAVPHVRCLRDGKVREIEATLMVPGDIFFLEAGGAVPADGRLVEAVNLKVEEATLTGESIPVDKTTDPVETEAVVADRHNIVHLGTSVTFGRAKAVAVKTGMRTELGRVAQMLDSVQSQETVLQRRMNRLGKRLALMALALVGIIFLLGVLRGFGVTEMLLTAITLAVAAVPEGLPAVVTIALALGARRMVERKALIRRLPAVETLGSVTTICSDKTGTLTENRMKATTLQAGRSRIDVSETDVTTVEENAQRDLLLVAGALCNDATRREGAEGGPGVLGDPTEVALAMAAGRWKLDQEELRSLLPRVGEVPFSSDRKRMSTVHQVRPEARRRFAFLPPEPYAVFCKGAVERVLAICTETWEGHSAKTLDENQTRFFRECEDQLAGSGQRVLGVAFRGLENLPEPSAMEGVEEGMRLVGLVGISDPARPEAKTAIEMARSAGIRVMMITGDHQKTAQAIAQAVALQRSGDGAVDGRQLLGLSPAQFEESVAKVSVFARVTPEQKLRIVEALQRQGEIVAVTGDGVNDAPALKRAEIGVAMGVSGTDVAKEAADAVLLDDNFATIVAAIEEGRTIYDNIRKFVRYLLATNLGEICAMLAGLLGGLPVPLLPLQILWINLITDGLPALALGVEPAEPDIMKRPPHPPGESLFSRGLWQHVLWVGLMMGALVYWVQWSSISTGAEAWQTMVFTTLALAQMAHVLAIRSERRSLFQQGLFSNKWMVAAVSSTVLLQLAVVYVPFLQRMFDTRALSPRQLLLTAGVASLVFVAVELEKMIRRARLAGGPG